MKKRKDAEDFVVPERVAPRPPRKLHPSIDPIVQSATAIQFIDPPFGFEDDEPGLTTTQTITRQIREQVAKLESGDTEYVKATLLCQMQILQLLFTRLIEWSFVSRRDVAINVRFPLALKVENQLRLTAETLGKLCQPGRPMIVQQQHISVLGQVPDPGLHSVEVANPNFKPANELLESPI